MVKETLMWKIFKKLFGITEDVDRVEDFLPYGEFDPKKHKKKLEKAQQKHGKKFHTHTTKLRETPPSHRLTEIEKKAPKPVENVQPIRKAK
jgi:hypothetical protein